jgi:hypothetical protein
MCRAGTALISASRDEAARRAGGANTVRSLSGPWPALGARQQALMQHTLWAGRDRQMRHGAVLAGVSQIAGRGRHAVLQERRGLERLCQAEPRGGGTP